ncbi:MAG TPA: alpha-L-arabinofuranosidase C-terminal domain-containing protein [Candidatus Hydrogenedens sp.]|nr:alpha-L-arabinofuranosidase C-terminal domain-containing protein [Candidatus Hydrogenedens sp.]
MKTNAILFLTIILLTPLCFAQVVFEEAFEQGTNAPDGWQTKVWQGKGEFQYPVTGKNGNAVQISSSEGGDLSWFKEVDVSPFAQYKLSGWIKTDNIQLENGAGALLNIHGIDGARTEALFGTNDWKYVETTFFVSSKTRIMVNCLFGGWGLAKGSAIFDDVKLEKISEMVIGDMQISIDPSKKGTPIHPFIYGQFIEHLGRCIYGGIWAEMLEDRKFFYLINTPDSPWKLHPTDMMLFIDQIHPYTSWYTPVILLNPHHERGLVQEGLEVVAGKEYMGRVVLKSTHPDVMVKIFLRSGDSLLGEPAVIQNISQDYQKYTFRLKVDKDGKPAQFAILATGQGNLFIGSASLMPADNIKGMRADTLTLLKQLNSPIYRWPGGNFVSGYNWKDGIGDPDKRPTRKNPAWGGIDTNDFGLDEFIQFCREIGTEPLAVVNTGLGDVNLARDMVEYANGSINTPMGKWRTDNGNPEPYKITYWGVGNEMYGEWQLGHVPVDDYVKRHNAFAEAMKTVDSNIKLVGVGENMGIWSKKMLENCANNMDYISEHFYCGDKKDVFEHVYQLAERIKAKVKNHKSYLETIPTLKEKFIPIAMDEWNYWYGDHVYGELGCVYHLKDALGVAIGLHEFFRNSDVITMANYAQTVNVISAIKTTKTKAFFDTTGLALMLYRQHFGSIPVAVDVKSVSNDNQSNTPMVPIDVFAAWKDEQAGIMTLAVVNPLSKEIKVRLDVKDKKVETPKTAWILTGKDPMSTIIADKEPEVWLSEMKVNKSTFPEMEIPPLSIVMTELKVK